MATNVVDQHSIEPGEGQFAENVKAEMKHESLPDDENLLLYEAALVLGKACRLVGNDISLMHLSVDCKRPALVVLGRPMEKHWTFSLVLHDGLGFVPVVN